MLTASFRRSEFKTPGLEVVSDLLHDNLTHNRSVAVRRVKNVASANIAARVDLC